MSLYSAHEYDITKLRIAKITFPTIINYNNNNCVKTYNFTCKYRIIMMNQNHSNGMLAKHYRLK